MQIFSEDAVNKVRSLIKLVNAQSLEQQSGLQGSSPSSADVYIVTISGSPETVYYPGNVQLYHSDTSSYSTLGDCWCRELNGAPLGNARYLARRAGYYTSTVSGSSSLPLYLTEANLTVRETDGSPTIDGVGKISFHSDDFVLTEPMTKEVQVKTAGLTATKSVVQSVTCASGSLNVTTVTWTIRDGLIVSVA